MERYQCVPPLFDVLVEPRWGDQDSLGHINHVNYFSYLEEARVRWLEADGLWGDEPFLLVLAAIGLHRRSNFLLNAIVFGGLILLGGGAYYARFGG